MPTLIYTPAIRAHIQPSKGSTLDISEDLVSWTLTLRENAAHTFQFRLQNAQRKYDGKFLPMDRISVGLKRINWLQNFTGYIDVSPIFQAWPGTLDLSATCTLKIPLYHYWDPNTSQSFAMIADALQHSPEGKTIDAENDGNDAMTNLILQSMTKVLGWQQKRIHVGQIPKDWTKWASKVGEQIDKDMQVYATLGGKAIISGSTGGDGSGGSGTLKVNLPAGSYGGMSLNATQAHNASEIYNAISFDMNMPTATNVKVMAMMCAIVESGGIFMYANKNNPASMALPHDKGKEGTDGGSVGYFQQQVTGAPNSTGSWGTTQELMDPVISTKKFVKALLTVMKGSASTGGPSESSYGAMVQSVQGSSYPGRYQVQLTPAKAIVAAMDKLSKSGTSGSAATPAPADSSDPAPATATADASGNQMAVVAVNLIKSHAASKKWIIYNEGGDDKDSTDLAAVKTLDCSSLVDWVYFHSTGGKHLQPGGGRSNVAAILARCQSKGKTISIDLAKYVRGAVLIEGPNGHVGVSVGDGKNHVAAHMQYPDPSKDCDVSPIDGGGHWTTGGLLPGINYADSGSTQKAADDLKSIMKYPKTTVAPPIASIADPTGDVSGGAGGGGSADTAANALAQLVNGVYYNPQDSAVMGDLFGGAVMLLNDQPFLPWLQNVVASSMRSFCSAPNGDFIAWFPDYFGIWKSAAVMNIETIELQNFAVYWADASIVTHQFVLGNTGVSGFDPNSGSVGFMGDSVTDLTQLAQMTNGIATMDYPEIFSVIYGSDHTKGADSGFINAFLERFGARPDHQMMPYIQKGKPEFFMALYLFMQKWANQFSASVPLTFMPELFPGMLLRIPDYGFQAYVQQVTHQAVYGQGGAFTTTVGITAPSTVGTKNKTTTLAWLPQGAQNV